MRDRKLIKLDEIRQKLGKNIEILSKQKRFLIIKYPCTSSFRYRYLPAADALFNQKCSVNFEKGDSIPKDQHDIPNEQRKLAGRPSGVAGQNGRAAARKYRTLPVRRMHKKLEEYFSDDIMILRQKDRANMIVTGKPVANIICDYQRQNKCSENLDAEKFRIVEAIAKLIKNLIKLMRTSLEFYPSPEEISSEQENNKLLPDILKTFLDIIINKKSSSLEKNSIEQALMQAARQRSLS
ncbi:unnamed protein product [Phaedon cochleariae]|uniref:Uncharacterized protein n=1 Tax=Phaedon cochleariae TaxID=80249 RepID=A0A9N9X7I8_PHACE|nr:unnamed protein product [Phaedon cochleariae]